MFRKMPSANVVVMFSFIALSAIQANASLLVDLRFDSGTPILLNAHSVQINPAGGVYTIEVWAQVRGTDTTGTNEKILSFFGSIQSQQVNGGAIVAGTSGVSGNSGFGPAFTTTSPPGQAGTPQNFGGDGVRDWGTTSTSNLNTIKFNTTDNSGLNFEDSSYPGITANLLDEGSAGAGVEFLVGKSTITVNAADVATFGSRQTIFNWIKGTGTAPAIHTVRLDGSGTNEIAAQYLASVSPANSVTFVLVPEPGSAALSGVCLLGIAARRRHKFIAP